MLLDMSTSLIPQSNHGIMVEEEVVVEDLGSLLSPSQDSSSSSSSEEEEEEEEEEDFMEDGASSASSSSPPPASDDGRGQEGPLFDMSSLMAQLPLKRGLSRFYQGKSQSFTCMSSVRSLEDLAKPERKKSRSCGGNLDSQRSVLVPKVCSKVISKKASKGFFGASISSRKQNSFMGNRPPMPPQRSNSISGQTLLFA